MATTDAEQNKALSDDELQDLVASTDTGGRKPTAIGVVKLMAGLSYNFV